MPDEKVKISPCPFCGTKLRRYTKDGGIPIPDSTSFCPNSACPMNSSKLYDNNHYSIVNSPKSESAHNELCKRNELGKLVKEYPVCPVCHEPLQEIQSGLWQCDCTGGAGYRDIVRLGKLVEAFKKNPPKYSGIYNEGRLWKAAVQACLDMIKVGKEVSHNQKCLRIGDNPDA